MSDTPATVKETISQGEHTVHLQVLRDDNNKWWLQPVDEQGNNTVWEDAFNSAEEALSEGRTAIKEEGIAMFVGSWDTLL